MFSLWGAPALSQFRLDHLLRLLRARDSRVTALASRWLHFVDALRPLADSESRLLDKLLTYGPKASAGTAEPGAQAGRRILVTPRVGTESPGPARPPTSCMSAGSMPSSASSAARCISSNRRSGSSLASSSSSRRICTIG